MTQKAELVRMYKSTHSRHEASRPGGCCLPLTARSSSSRPAAQTPHGSKRCPQHEGMKWPSRGVVGLVGERESRFDSDQERRDCFALPEILASKLEQPSRDCPPTPEQRHLSNSTKYSITNPTYCWEAWNKIETQSSFFPLFSPFS